MNKFRKDTTVNISKPIKKELRDFLPAKTKLNGWIEEAIIEKMQREITFENPVMERNQIEKR